MWEQFLRVLIGVPNSQLTTNFLAKYQLTANPISTLISICTTHLEAEFMKNINSRISVLAESSTNENVVKKLVWIEEICLKHQKLYVAYMRHKKSTVK